MRTIRLAALNIVMPPPHNADRYIRLMETTYELRRIVGLRGRYRGMLGALYRESNFVRGQIYKFFNLDPESEWFNIATREQADEGELQQIRIPDNLKPHLTIFDFIFFPRQHRLIFVTQDSKGSLSPNLAKHLLDILFEAPPVVQEFGEIEITIEPHRERLNQILQMPGVKKITIELLAPNADDSGVAERQVLRRLDAMGAKKMTTELVARANKDISLDAPHRTLARVAQSNGSVTATAYDDQGAAVVVSTTEHPLVERVTHDPRTETESAAIERGGTQLLNKISDRN